MTIGNSRASITLLGDGVNRTWAYNFRIPFQADGSTPAVAVTTTDSFGRNALLDPTAYTISGVDESAGGTVTYPPLGTPLPTGAKITIQRAAKYVQETTIPNNAFFPKTVEDVADTVEMQIGQLKEKLDRAVVFPVPDVGTTLVGHGDRELTVWANDANGQFYLAPFSLFTGGGGTDTGVPGNFTIGKLYWDYNAQGSARLVIRRQLNLPDPVTGDTDNPGGFRPSNFWYWDKWDAAVAPGSRMYFNIAFYDSRDPSEITSKKSNYNQMQIAYSRLPSGTGFSDPGQVSNLTKVHGGSGYTSVPTVTAVGGGGSGAVFLAVVSTDGRVIDITIVNGGHDYVTIPTISITGGGGSGAEYTAEINGRNFWPQEVGPYAGRAVIAAGNTTGKAEGLVLLAGHEDDTADGKLVIAQLILEHHGADFGWGRQIEDDGDPVTPPAAYPGYGVRGNNAGTTLGNQWSCLKPGKKFALQEGNVPCGFYHTYCADPDFIWLGTRDPGYNAVAGDGLSTEKRAGSLLRHWGQGAWNGWGWISTGGNDDPQMNLDFRTAQAGEVFQSSIFNNDATVQATNRVFARERRFALNSSGTLQRLGPTDILGENSTYFGTEFTRIEHRVKDNVAGTEDGALDIWTMVAGTVVRKVTIDDAIGLTDAGGTVLLGINAVGKLFGTQAATTKAAIAAAADLAALKTALATLFA